MSGQPYLKFFTHDWRADPCLQRCTWAARGLWMEMLCIMHENNGFLAVGGVPLSVAELARMCGGPEDEAHVLLAELERATVFSKDDTGTIYSRRIVRDISRFEQARDYGKRGGNPRLINGVNPPPNRPLKARAKGSLKSARARPESTSDFLTEEVDDRASPREASDYAQLGVASPLADDQRLQEVRRQIEIRFHGQQRNRILAKLDNANDPVAYGYRCLADKNHRETAKVVPIKRKTPEQIAVDELRAELAAYGRTS
jgi:hypothetical protein